MNRDFFKRERFDSGKRDEAVDSLDQLIDSLDNWISELQAFSRALEEKKDELSDCDNAKDLQAVASDLRKVDVPDGCDNLDWTPDGIADEAEEAVSDEDTFFSLAAEVGEDVRIVAARVRELGRGCVLPSSATAPEGVDLIAGNSARWCRPGASDRPRPTMNAEDLWRRALVDVLRGGASQCGFRTEDEQDKHVEYLIDNVRTVMKTVGAKNGHPAAEHDWVLALMWFVNDLLQCVLNGMGNASDRPIVVTPTSLRNALGLANTAADRFKNLVDVVSEAVDDCKI